jgi:HEAT repeat protein
MASKFDEAVQLLQYGTESERLAAIFTLAEGTDGINPLRQAAKADKSPAVRHAAILALSGAFPEHTALIETYLALLQDTEATVRSAAVLALGNTKANDLVYAAVLGALNDENKNVRLRALNALKHGTMSENVFPALLGQLSRAEGDEVNLVLATIRALVIDRGLLPDDPTPLIDLVLHYKERLQNPAMNLWLAAETLSYIPDTAVIPALIRVVDYDPQLNLNATQSISVRTLRSFKHLSAGLTEREIATALADSLMHGEPRTRISAAAALGMLGGDAAYVKLRPQMEVETNPEVREVINAMTRLVAPPNPLHPGESLPPMAVSSSMFSLPNATRVARVRWEDMAGNPEAPFQYTLRLLKLECLQQQELDGDEVFITIGDHIIWQSERLHLTMVAELRRGEQFNMYDFKRAMLHGVNGWVRDVVYTPADFELRNLDEALTLQLWESDGVFKGGDDMLGQVVISPLAAQSKTNTVVTFSDNDARYRLTYRVSEEGDAALEE